MNPPSPLSRVRPAFRAVVRAVAPAAVTLHDEARRQGEAAVDEALAARPADVRRQFVLFVRVLSVLAFLRYGRSFARLPVEKARSLLSVLERAPLLLLRRGMWGVRTLAFMAVYAHPEVQDVLGYRARAEGWEARGGGQGAWPDRDGVGAPEPGIITSNEGPVPGGEHGPRADDPSGGRAEGDAHA